MRWGVLGKTLDFRDQGIKSNRASAAGINSDVRSEKQRIRARGRPFFLVRQSSKAHAFVLDNRPIKGKIPREISGLTA
jgi:hypothetical protein